MKKTHKLFSLLLVTAFLILSVGIISAEADMVTPADSATISGTSILNASGTNLINCTFYAKSSLTANSSWSSLGTFSNETGSASSINGTFDSSIIEDANNYIFNATCRNDSNSLLDGTTTTGITVDNTVPTSPSSLSPSDSSVDTDGSVTFSGTVTGSKTTSCTLMFDGINFGGSSQSMTHTGDTCTLTLNNIPEQSYRWYIRASDETNTTDSSTQTVTISTASAKTTPEIQKRAINTLSIGDQDGNIPVGLVVTIIASISLLVIYNRNKR